MANAFSTIQRYNQYVDPIDNNRVRQVLQAKQERFDANSNMVNSAIQSFANVDLIRDEDKAYLMDNLSKVIDVVDNAENIDFSKSGIGSELTTYISQAIDSKVLDQIQITQGIRNYNQKVQEVKDKNPELYAQQNDWYATQSAGLQQYLSGQTDNLGKLEYNPYYDYEKDLDKNILTWAKEIGIDPFSIETTTKDGIRFNIEGTELKKSDVKDFIRSKMNQQAQNQIFIDNAYKYQEVSDNKLFETYKNYHSDLLDSTKNRIAIEKDILKQKGLDVENNPFIKELRKKEAFHKKQIDSSNLDRNEVTKFIGFESYLDRKSEAYADKDYTKLSPDNTDIRRAELQLKKQKERASSAQNATTLPSGIPNVPGTLSPIETPFEDKESLQDSFTTLYDNTRTKFLAAAFGKDTEFKNRYEELNSEEARFEAIQHQIAKYTDITVGEDVDPEMSRLASEMQFYAKNIETVNTKYKEGIESTADQLYDSMLSEIRSQGNDLNLSDLAIKYPQTVKLLQTKGGQLTKKERDLIRYEYAMDAKGLSGLSDNANNALNTYIDNQYEKIKDIQGTFNPNEKSEFRKAIGKVGSSLASSGRIIGSGFDEEVIKQEENREKVKIDTEELANEIQGFGQGLMRTLEGIGTAGISELFRIKTDTGIRDFDQEDLQLRDKKNNPILAQDLITETFKKIEGEINTQLSSSENRAPKSFELVLSPTTTAKNTGLRAEIANFMAAKTGRNIKAGERVAISINKQDRSATIVEIDEKEGRVPKRFNLEDLPASIVNQFDTKQKDWIYSVENPNAVSKSLNYTIPDDRSKGYKHIENLAYKYGVPAVAQKMINREEARKEFAPTKSEMLSYLTQEYPKQSSETLNRLLLTPYEFKFVPDQRIGLYTVQIFDKSGSTKKQVYSNAVPMTTFNEAEASTKVNAYLLDYFKSILN